MRINSNEEYYPIGNRNVLKGPYYLVSCKSDGHKFTCVAESDHNVVRISFARYVACRITDSSFRDYDMRNRFCEHVIYEIKNSLYLEQINSSYMNQNDYHHYLVSLDENIIDVVSIEPVIICLSKCLDKTGKDISDSKENILYVEETKPLSISSVPYENYDQAVFNGLQERSLPIENFHEGYELFFSNYGAIDLELIIKPINRSKKERTIVFPNILCYKELTIPQKLSGKTIAIDSLQSSFIYEIQDSNFKEWLAYAGYRQLYGDPKHLRHISVQLHNTTYDVLIDSEEERPYCIKDKIK